MRKAAGFIASWWFTALLLLVLGGTYASFSFGKNPWPAWTAFVLRHPVGLAVLIALIVNLLAASVRIVQANLFRRSLSKEDILRMDAHIMIQPTGSGTFDALLTWMKQKGFSPVRNGQALHAVRGTGSFLPGTLFRLGIVLFLLAVLASSLLRRSERTVLHAGDPLSPFGMTMTLTEVRTDLPDDLLQVGEESALRLEKVIAKLSMNGRTLAVTSRSPERIEGMYYRVVHLGYAQPVLIKGLRNPFSRMLDLDILPPGKSAVHSLPKDDRFLTFTLEPERTITKGLLKGKEFDLTRPRYQVVVQKGHDQARSQRMIVKPGEHGSAGGLTLSFGDQSFFVTMEIVRDSTLFWVRGGLFLALTGLALMLLRSFWYDKRFCAVREGDTLWVGYSEEFYRKWGIARFQDWKAELEELKRP